MWQPSAATGAVGLPLVRALCTSGREVTGMTRAGLGVDRLPEIGAPASSADAFDRQAVRGAIAAGGRDVVIDQLTWLRPIPQTSSSPYQTTRGSMTRAAAIC